MTWEVAVTLVSALAELAVGFVVARRDRLAMGPVALGVLAVAATGLEVLLAP